MNRTLLFLILLAFSAGRCAADDGSWVTDRGYVPAEGALYSETGNPDIVMEKEYLELRDIGLGTTRAVFQFRNTADAAVTAECAFPISFDFVARPITLDGKGNLAADSDSPGLFRAWDFGDVVPSRHSFGRQGSLVDRGFVNDLISALAVPVDRWDAAGALKANTEDPDLYYAGTYFRDDQYPRGRVELDAVKLQQVFGFRILQDGKGIPVTTCVVEFGDGPGRLVLHFRHQLSFAANTASVVTVTYAMPTRSAVSGDPASPRAPGISQEFTWKYILQTASSWKDTLGRIVLSVRPGFQPDLAAPWRYVGTAKGQLLYTAESWKPKPEENLALAWKNTLADYPGFWRTMTEPLDPGDFPPVESPAKLLGASSFLPETADVFLPTGIWRNAPFGADRLFDGLPETAWVVRTARSGIGEYVRFSLDTAIDRIEIFNGYQRSTVNFPEKDTWSYFGKNNRVKTLDLVWDGGGLVEKLDLADTREVQRFNVSLPAGIYRAVIADVYPGSRWNDTCMGEMTFFPGTAAGFDDLNRDAFFSSFLK